MRKFPLALLLVLIFSTSLLSNVSINQKQVGNDTPLDSLIHQELTVTNEGATSLLLSNLVLTYYFYDTTSAMELIFATEEFSHGTPGDVLGSIEEMPLCEKDGRKANKQLTVTFPNSGNLLPSEEIQVRFNVSGTGGELFDENSHWSYREGQWVTDFNGVALFLADGGEEINGSIEIFGDVISEGSGNFCDGSNDSRFHGDVRFYNTEKLVLRGGTFEQSAYFDGPVYIDTRSPLFKNGVGFNGDLTVAGDNDPELLEGSLYINGRFKTEYAGAISLNNNDIFGRSDVTHLAATTPKPLLSLVNNAGAGSVISSSPLTDIEKSLGMPSSKDVMPVLNKEVLDSFAINAEYGWAKLFSSSGANSARINAVYDSINAGHPDQLLGGAGGYLVIRPKTSWAQSFTQDGGEVTGKIIWLFDTVDMKCSSRQMYRSGPNSSTMILLTNNKSMQRLSGYGYFRGVIWNESGGDCIYSSEGGTIEGAILHRTGTFRTEKNGGKLILHYNPSIIEEISALGVFQAGELVSVPAENIVATENSTHLWGTAPGCVSEDTIPPYVVISSPLDNDTLCDSIISILWSVDGVEQSEYLTENLVHGENVIIRSSVDEAGNIGADTVTVFADLILPVVSITSPLSGMVTKDSSVVVEWSIDGIIQFSETVESLVEGENRIVRSAANSCGLIVSDSITVFADFTAPVVDILSPANNYLTNEDSIVVTFTVDGVADSATYLLTEGENTLTVTKSDAVGNETTETVSVIRDTQAPALVLLSPSNDTAVADSAITVHYTVDGDSASKQFALTEGSNTLTIDSADALSNSASISVVVTADFTVPEIVILSPADSELTNKDSITVLFTVDGISDSAKYALVEGTNTLTVTKSDVVGNTTSKTVSVIRDTQAPVLTIISPANDTATADSNIIVLYTVDGDTTSKQFSLTEGPNTLTIDTADAAGNSASISVTVTADFTAPVVVLVSPAEGFETNLDSITVVFTVDGVNDSARYGLVEGSNTLTVTKSDAVGNETTATVSIIHDTQAPVLTLVSPSKDTVVADSSITVVYTVDGDTASKQFSLSESANTLTIDTVDNAGNSSSISVVVTADFTAPEVAIISPAEGFETNLPSVEVIFTVDGVEDTAIHALVEGTNTLTVEKTDAAGNTTTKTVTVILDTQSPVLVLVSPSQDTLVADSIISVVYTTDGDTVARGFTLSEGVNTLTIDTVDNAGNSAAISLVVKADYTAPIIKFISPADSLETNLDSITVVFTLDGVEESSTFSLIEGVNTITIERSDPAGNKSSESTTVIRDTQAPEVEIRYPVDHSSINTPSVNVEWYVDSVLQHTNVVEELVDGSNTIVRSFTDNAGNSMSDTVTVILDTVAPVVTIISPLPGTTVPTPVVTVVWEADGVRDSADYSLVEGLNDLSVEVTDEAGNSTTENFSLVLDTQAPEILFIAPTTDTTIADTFFTLIYSVDGDTLTRALALVEGENTILVDTTDDAGNRSIDSLLITLDACDGSAIQIKALCEPSAYTGADSLTVTFKSYGWSRSDSIVKYRWDFDGDGVWDLESDTSRTHPTYHYDSVGIYPAKFEVEDNTGIVDRKNISIVICDTIIVDILRKDFAKDSVEFKVSLPDSTLFDSVSISFDGDTIWDTTLTSFTFTEELIRGLDWNTLTIEDSLWQIGTPEHGPASANSGNHVIGTNLKGNYPDNCDASFYINKKSNEKTLSFYHWYYIQTGWDFGYLDYSIDNGKNWINLKKYDGNSGGWVKEVVDIEHLPELTLFRFRFTSNYNFGTFGWFIDIERAQSSVLTLINDSLSNIPIVKVYGANDVINAQHITPYNHFEVVTPSFGCQMSQYKSIDAHDSSEINYDDLGYIRAGRPDTSICRPPSGNDVIIAYIPKGWGYSSVELELETWMTNLRFRRLNPTTSSWKIEGTIDGGESWTVIDHLTSATQTWELKDYDIKAFATGQGRIRLIFDGLAYYSYIDELTLYSKSEIGKLPYQYKYINGNAFYTIEDTLKSEINYLSIDRDSCTEVSIHPVEYDPTPLVDIHNQGKTFYSNSDTINLEWSINGQVQPIEKIVITGDTTIIRSVTSFDGKVGADTTRIILDTVPPVVAIVSPDDSTYTKQKTFDLAWTIDGNNKVESRSFTNEGATVFSVTGYDYAGNFSRDSITVIWDTTKPIITIDYPRDGIIVPDSVINYLYSVDGTYFPVQEFILTSEGANWLSVDYTDLAGNYSKKTIAVYKGRLVPDVVGKNFNNAIDDLTNSDLKFDTVWINDARPTGEVIAMSPVAGDTVQRNTPIELVISRGSDAIDLKPLSLDATGINTDPSTLLMSGEAVVTLTNDGNKVSNTPFSIILFEDRDNNGLFSEPFDNLLGTDTILTLNASDTIQLTMNISDTALFDENPIFVSLDIENSIVETNEANNSINSMADCENLPENTFTPVIKELLYHNSDWSIVNPVVINTNDDNGDGIIDEVDIPEIIYAGNAMGAKNQLYIIDGKSKNILYEGEEQNIRTGYITAGDIDADGEIEILASTSLRTPAGKLYYGFYCYDSKANVKWKVDSDSSVELFTSYDKIDIADIDHDGYSEILAGKTILNHDGTIRKVMSNTLYITQFDDVDNDGTPDIVDRRGKAFSITGDTIFSGSYQHNLKRGITPVVSIISNSGHNRFLTAGNLSSDKSWLFHDALSSQRIQLDTLNHHYPNNLIINEISDIVGDYNNDGVNDRIIYGYVPGTNQHTRYLLLFSLKGELVWAKELTGILQGFDYHQHVINTFTAFDLNGDGTLEIIAHKDSYHSPSGASGLHTDSIVIIDGENGVTLHSISLDFITNGNNLAISEIIAADIDNDNSVELVLQCNGGGSWRWPGQIIIEEKNGKWVDARNIWNNPNYHVTNINDDGTVPQFEAAPTSYRVQETINPLACKDLSISRLRVDQTSMPDSLRIMARVGNSGVLQFVPGTNVAFFDGDPDNGGTLLGITQVEDFLKPGEYRDITFSTADYTRGMRTIYAVVDRDSLGESRISESDENNNSVSQNFYINNESPVFTSLLTDSVISVGEAWSYSATTTDADGDTAVYRLLQAPAGVTIDSTSGVVSWPASFTGSDHRYVITIQAEDPYDGRAEHSIRVYYDVDNNSAPVIQNSLADSAEAYYHRDTVIATDADGDALEFFLISGPEYFSVVPNSGVVKWYADTSVIGQTFDVVIGVTDNLNGWDTLRTQMTVKAHSGKNGNIKPYIISYPDTIALVDSLYKYRPASFNNELDVLTYWVATGPLGMTITPNVEVVWTPTESQVGEHTVTIAVTDDIDTTWQTYQVLVRNSFDMTAPTVPAVGTPDQNSVVIDTVDTDAPVVGVNFTPQNPNAGEVVTFTVTATDANLDSARVWLKVIDQYLPLENGTAIWTAPMTGTFAVQAMAFDSAGNYGDSYTTITVSGSGADTEKPLAEILSPERDTAVNGTVEILGTVSDANLSYWTLSSRAVDSDEWVEFHRDSVSVTEALLGEFDATILENGTYTVRLVAYDKSGNGTASQVPVRVTGQKKIGHFSLSFSDMTLNLPGMSLSADRIYDSRNKESGDFGYGWNLALTSMKLMESVVPGENWTLEMPSFSDALQGYSLKERGKHTITIAIPGGRDQVFDVKASLPSRFNPFMAEFAFEPQSGTYSTLEPLGITEVTISGGVIYGDNDPFNPYNPQQYKLTLLDGTAYIFDQNIGGVTAMIDPNGNRVDLTGDRITHSAGDTLNFIRDEQNRITAITDGERTVNYTYDGHGNLAKVTDPMGYVTTFKYGQDHYLNEIIDPRGVQAIRTVYDDNGRMKYQINAEGDTLTYDHDLANGKSSTTDFGGNKTEYEYDSDGNVTMQVNAVGDTTRYEYDDNGNQTKTINPDNTFRTSKYDAHGNDTLSVNENGDTTRSNFSNGRINSTTDALNRTTEYKYDSKGNLTVVIGPDGDTTSATTYLNGNIATETDAMGYTTEYKYDSRGRMTHQISPTCDTTEYILDNRGNTIATIDVRGDTTKFIFDDNDNRTATISPEGDTTKTTYTSFGKVESQTNLRGQVTTFGFDLFGQQDSTFHADGTVTTKTFDAQGNVKTSTDKAGRTTSFEYDHEKRITKTIFNDSSFTEVNYDSRGRRVATIAARFPSQVEGDTTKYEYDDVGNNTAVITPLGDTTKYEYDAAGRRVAMVDVLNQRTTYSFDDYDRLDTTTYHDGSYTVTEYDEIGRKVAEIDAENNRTSFDYDTSGALIKVTDAMTFETGTQYDSLGQKTALIDANGNITNLVYDSLGRMVEKLYPAVEGERDSEKFIYNDLNELVETIVGTDTTDIEYDSLGREKLKTFRNSGHTVETFYGVSGQVDSVIDYRGTTSYEYDIRGRQWKVSNPDGTSIEYTYDAGGNKTKTITAYPGGVEGDTTEFTYDALNRMVHTINGEDTTTYFYNAVGNRDSVTFGNGTATAYDYDVLNRLTKVTNVGTVGQVLSSYEYVLNKAGIRTAVVEANGDSVLYTYDDLYRLTNERRTGIRGYEISYTYDKVGNRKTQTKDGELTEYVYNERDQIEWEIVGTDSTGYAYDKSGRLYMKHDKVGTTWYNWTDNNRLRQLITPDTTITYEYDFRGVKVKEGDKTLLVDHSQRYAQVIAEIEGTDTVNYTFGLERIAQNRKGTVHYYLADGQGSIRQLTDAAGTVTDEYGYYAFGETLYETGSTENSFRYTGESYDPNSGFYYLRARWMNPSQGRFVSVDPYAGDPMAPVSLHRYLYANQSPVSMSDPSGLVTLTQLNVAMTISGVLAGTALYHFLTPSEDREWYGYVASAVIGGVIGFSIAKSIPLVSVTMSKLFWKYFAKSVGKRGLYGLTTLESKTYLKLFILNGINSLRNGDPMGAGDLLGKALIQFPWYLRQAFTWSIYNYQEHITGLVDIVLGYFGPEGPFSSGLDMFGQILRKIVDYSNEAGINNKKSYKEYYLPGELITIYDDGYYC